MHLARQVTAGLLVVLALGLALRPGPAGPAAPVRPPDVEVVVAAADLGAGAVLGATDLALLSLPAGAVPDGVAAAVDQVTGQVLAGPLRRGEPVTDVRLVGPGLRSQVPAGQVAAPVRLADLAVAALVRTGDRVDVLATRPDAPDAEVVADGVLVLAAPGVTANQETAPAAGLLLIAVDGATAARLAAAATTATLTVSLPPS